jgi:hypothetical protein
MSGIKQAKDQESKINFSQLKDITSLEEENRKI